MIYAGQFEVDIREFNAMYRMPKYPGFSRLRLEQFVNILSEEIKEHEEITDIVGLCDWLGDIIIYCASELHRHNVSVGGILDVIMLSNFSKMGEDGKPIYDERGKLMKGPNYTPPETMIARYLYSIASQELANEGDALGSNGTSSGCEQEVTR